MTDRSELGQYLWVLRRWLWLIASCTFLAAGSAFVVSSRTTPVYRALATLLVQQAPSGETSDYTALLTSERLARTYSEMLTGRPVLESTIAELGLEETPAGLTDRVEVELVRDTQLIRLSVEDTDPARAARIADTLAETFIAANTAFHQERYADSLASMQAQLDELSVLIKETQGKIEGLDVAEDTQEQAELAHLETILAGYRNTYATLLQNYEQMRLTAAQSADDVMVFEDAEAPSIPIRPRPLRNTALAAVTGAMVAVGVAFLIEYLDDTIKTPDDVSRALGMSTLGTVGRLGGEGELVTADQPLSPVSEAFRVLRTNIRFSGVDGPLRTLLVTSAGPLEGKSLTVANLAVAMAQAGMKVAVVDGDLRRPRLDRVFNLHAREGLTQSLLEGSTDGRLQPVQNVDDLYLLPSGQLPPNPVEMLGSQRARELLDALAQEMDVVLVDSPPVLPVADTAVLAQEVDGVLLVIEAGKTRRAAAGQAVEALQKVGANVIGVVLNKVSARRGGYYYYYHDYYRDGERRKRQRGRKGPLAAVRRVLGRKRKA